MAVDDIYRVTIVFSDTALGREYTCNLSVRQFDIPMGSITAIGDDVKEWWNTAGPGGIAMKSIYTPDNQLTRVELRRIKPLEPVLETYTDGLPIIGTGSTAGVSPSTAIVQSIRTSNVGRRWRGRIYLPSPTEAQVENDQSLSAALAGQLSAQLQYLFDLLEAENVVAGVFSRAGDHFKDHDRVLTDRRLRVQRRRQSRSTLYV